MAYTIALELSADRAFLALPEDVQKRIRPKIDALADNPRPSGARKERDLNAWEIRKQDYRVTYEIHVGDYLIVYEVYDRICRVLVLSIRRK